MSFKAKFKTYKRFMESWDGNMMCSCDHGCNQWLKEQQARVSLGYRMLKLGSKNLDKLASLDIKRVNKIWYWVAMNDNRRMNENGRKSDKYQHYLEILPIADLAIIALAKHNNDHREAAKELGVKWYALKDFKEYRNLDQAGKLECQEEYRKWQEYLEEWRKEDENSDIGSSQKT